MAEKKVEGEEKPNGENIPSTVGFRPSKKVYAILREAEKATGAERAAFISACIEEAAEAVVKRILEEQFARAREALEKLKTKRK